MPKTIQEIWEEVPWGQAIHEPGYLTLCKLVHDKAYRSIKEMRSEIPRIFDMTCEAATKAVLQWETKQKELNPYYLEDYKRDKLNQELEK